MRELLLLTLLGFCLNSGISQSCDCPYPIIFLHGFTGNQDSYSGTYTDPDFAAIWGGQADIFHAVLNAQASTNIWGSDGIPGNADDDVLYSFNNEPNVMTPGCVYSINFESWWNEDESNPILDFNTCDAPSFFSSNSNESAIFKSGYALGKMIESVLAANPTKDKVIVVGHSMGGLNIREYLQRDGGAWWAATTPGHGVKKAVTTVTPHLGSNFFGNPWPLKPGEHNMAENGLPDINSEATRDLRYSYAFNPLDPNNCGFFSSCPGPYLFGGDESMPWGYWNHDINCDGDDDQEDIIIGINNSGGTYDNTSMPLPTDLRYSWITSDVGTGGDLVFDITRQWIYNGTNPAPFDGVSYRLTDTLLTDVNHLDVDDEVNTVVRGLDEGDYPRFVWDLELNNLVPYFGVAQLRSSSAPDGPNTRDPDWFRVFIPAGTTDDLCIEFTSTNTQNSQLDFFSSPSDYTSMATTGDVSLVLPAGTGVMTMNVLNADLVLGGYNYFRIIHDGVDKNTWRTPYKIKTLLKAAVPVELISFDAELVEDKVRLNWSTANEINNDGFEIYKSENGIDFRPISFVPGSGSSSETLYYSAYDEEPEIGTNYYKLKQIDFDGSFSWSRVVAIIFEAPIEFDLKVFPNPVGNELNIELPNLSEQKTEISIRDLNGKTVRTFAVRQDQKSLKIQVAELSSGLYTIELISGTKIFQKILAKN